MARPTRFLSHAILALLLLLALAVLGGWLALRASLPRLDGDLALPGLSAPVKMNGNSIRTGCLKALRPLAAGPPQLGLAFPN